MNNLFFSFREDVQPSDLEVIRNIVFSSGFFSKEEVEIAVELAQERLKSGAGSGYYFLFIEKDKEVIGYTCFGPISGTKSSFHLYWIAVHKNFRGLGIGRTLLSQCETIISNMGGFRIYAETSSREQYKPTRRFYQLCGYKKEAILKDFYDLNDSQVIYVKVLDNNGT